MIGLYLRLMLGARLSCPTLSPNIFYPLCTNWSQRLKKFMVVISSWTYWHLLRAKTDWWAICSNPLGKAVELLQNACWVVFHKCLPTKMPTINLFVSKFLWLKIDTAHQKIEKLSPRPYIFLNIMVKVK